MDWRARTGRVVRRRRAAHRRRRGQRRCRGTTRRSARSRCAARGSPATTTATRRPRSSTTAGCAPATSARSHPSGYVQITDRAKDVIKSGGEWISSVELENLLMAPPRRGRGERHRRARSALGRAAARVRRAQAGLARSTRPRSRPSSASTSPSGRCPSAGASSTRCPKTQRRQVRQEGAARPARKGRARR